MAQAKILRTGGSNPCYNRRTKQSEHHLIWYAGDGHITRGCAHCSYVAGRHEEPDADLRIRQAEQSRSGHARMCRRAVV